MQRRQRLFRGGNKILVRGLVLALSDLVQFLVELLELRRLGHEIFQHELRGLVRLVALPEEKLQAIVDEGQVEEKTVSSQAVTAVPNNLDSTFWIVPVQASEDFVVRETVGSFHGRIRGCPRLDHLVVILKSLTTKVSSRGPV